MDKNTLNKISSAEWEAICDNCGKCCMITLEDEDTGDMYHTNVLCRYFDMQQCRCSVYDKRCELVPNCLKLTPENVDKLPFMPKTCAYRKLFDKSYKEQPLMPLQGRAVSELEVKEEELEDHIVDWEDL
ncbi:MAG: YcgN family cysteine cluster protein [Alphaproteobacteria bacterium]|nr:YcgN family cysteine cluster protein [Alphaproteobacteria bacterium]